MKSLAYWIAALLITIPALSFAQASNEPVTRAEVMAQVVQAEQDGTLHQSKVHYPPAQPGAAFADNAFGSSQEGSSQAGRFAQPLSMSTGHSLYAHH